MGYYSERLAGSRLRECYNIAPKRVQQYLDAEIQFVMDRLGPGDSVLELGSMAPASSANFHHER